MLRVIQKAALSNFIATHFAITPGINFLCELVEPRAARVFQVTPGTPPLNKSDLQTALSSQPELKLSFPKCSFLVRAEGSGF